MRRLKSERGTAILETALTLPLLLLVSVSIFEFGRADQTWQVLTNAAREGARVAILPGQTPANVQARVQSYMSSGQLPNAGTASVSVNQGATVSIGGTATASASIVTVNYPFSFMVLQPVARLVVSGSTLGTPFKLPASAGERKEERRRAVG